MKKFLILAIISATAFSVSVQADIHNPPSNDHGPTRKLGRALSNLVFAATEIPHSIATINEQEGNSASAGYGVTQGVGRTLRRVRYGLQELVTFPGPTNKGKYSHFWKTDTIWGNGGMKEFPPELGWESKYDYCR